MYYQDYIHETVHELDELEKKAQTPLEQAYMRFLILLKEKGITQVQAAQQVGIKESQRQLVWKTYRKGGAIAVAQLGERVAGKRKLTASQLAELASWMDDKLGKTIREAQEYVQEQWQVSYSWAGLDLVFKQMNIALYKRPMKPSKKRLPSAES